MTLLVFSGNQGKVKEIASIFANSGKQVMCLKDIPSGLPTWEDVEEPHNYFLGNAAEKLLGALAYVHKLEEVGFHDITEVLVDDSGLCVPELGGEPGVFSARYAGIGATDRQNNQKLSEAIKKHFNDENSRGNSPMPGTLPAFFISLILRVRVPKKVIHKLSTTVDNFLGYNHLKQQDKYLYEQAKLACAGKNTVHFGLRLLLQWDHFFPGVKFDELVKIETLFGASFGQVIQEPKGSQGFGYDPHFVGNAYPDRSYAELSSEQKNAVSHRGAALRQLSLSE